MTRSNLRLAAMMLVLASSFGCGALAKKPIIKDVMADPVHRRDTLEATLSVLDEHPEYVDEAYAAARRHPKSMRRMIENAARDLKDPAFADLTASIVVHEPEAVAQAAMSTVRETGRAPETRAALSRAIVARPDMVVVLGVEDRALLTAVILAAVRIAEKDEKARAALVAALDRAAPQLVQLIAQDPKLLVDLVDPVLAAAQANPKSHDALVAAVQRAAPRLIQLAAEDPKMLTEITEAVLKAALRDKVALKELLKKLALN